ncbi:hypothetical protein MKW98_006650 [Papaver atlanticum]|uniref:Pectinesterase inhibitor domain-containing protein n=1 Tax=Papaver atlanticum TaxID=357466 RepID=A0AAD4T2N4_9MAGN|nr:hypothetical protein MKW98_006650 [Papaver atlanticum]
MALCAFQQFATADSVFIRNICKTKNYNKLCVSSLKSNSSSFTADVRGLAVIMIGIGMSNATLTSTYLSSQMLSNTNDVVMKKVLKECADKHTYANDALQSSLQDLSNMSFDYAFVDVTAAKDYPNSCHNAFPGLAYPPEMARREEYLVQICDIALGMIGKLLE